MRIALTMNNDLAAVLQRKAARSAGAFKRVVNSLLRAGFGVGEEMPSKGKSVKPLAMRTAFDPDNLNQLVDELEGEEYLRMRQRP